MRSETKKKISVLSGQMAGCACHNPLTCLGKSRYLLAKRKHCELRHGAEHFFKARDDADVLLALYLLFLHEISKYLCLEGPSLHIIKIK